MKGLEVEKNERRRFLLGKSEYDQQKLRNDCWRNFGQNGIWLFRPIKCWNSLQIEEAVMEL
jgi:hypothetical protein